MILRGGSGLPFFLCLSVGGKPKTAISPIRKNIGDMKFLTLDYIKQHSRIDFDCEDELLELYGEAAEDTVMNYLNRTLADLVAQYGVIPAPVQQAALMLVDISYQYRSPVTTVNVSIVPYTFDMLIKPYMKL